MHRTRAIRLVVSAALGLVTALATAASAGNTATGSTSSTGGVLVSYRADVSGSDQAALEHANGATRVDTIDDIKAVVLSVAPGAEQHVIDALTRSGKATYAEVDATAHATAGNTGTAGGVTPNDTYWSSQWGPAKINAPTAWQTTTGSSSVIVADVDTGIDFSHADLAGKTVAGYDFINNDSNPADDNGHGTSTAGIIAADTNNASGIAGMCWQCKIMPVKALDAGGSGSYAAIANAITWATDHGAQIINLSLGGSADSSTLHNAVIYARNHGALLVAAAGNNGTTNYNYPGGYPETLSVAATQSTDKLYSWSSYGSWVDVAAPGCDYATALGGGYNANFCGTSAATPVVTGLAALLKSANSAITAASMMSTLESTATSIGSVVHYGRVNADTAMAAVGGAPAPAPSTTNTVTFSGMLNNGNPSRSYAVSTGTGTLQAALSFTKASSLSLKVLTSSGTVVAQSSGGSPVSVSPSVSPGTYTVVVSGTSRATFDLRVTYPNP
jgi:subtilisin family serine protease